MEQNFFARVYGAYNSAFGNIIFDFARLFLVAGFIIIGVGEDRQLQCFTGIILGVTILAYIMIAVFDSVMDAVLTALAGHHASQEQRACMADNSESE